MAKTAKTAKSLGFYLVIGLLLVGLAGFGATSFSGGTTTAASVGSREITVQDYANALNARLRQLQQITGNPVTMEQARALGVDQQVLSTLVIEATLDDEAADLGLSVGDAEVRDRVIGSPEFAGLDGSFDRETYRRLLQNIGLSEGQYEDQIRRESARTILQAAVLGGVPRPTTYASTLAEWVGQRRSAAWVRVTEDDLIAAPAAPEEGELAAWYDENPDAFTIPETRRISYAWLTPEMLADRVEVTQEELRNLYDQRSAEYVQPERRLVERLVMPDADAAEAARAALDAGETTFETLVTDRGLDLADTDLGDVAEGDLGAAGEPVFAAAPGDVVGPVETSVGPAFYRVNAVLAAQETPFEEVEDDLRAELATDRARRAIEQEVERLNDLVAGGASIEDLAANSELEAGQIDWTEETSDGIAAYDEFRQAAASAEQGGFPELVRLEDGGVFALRLDEVVPPEQPPLEDVRDEALAAFEAARIRAAVIARAEALAEDIRESGTFAVPGREGRVDFGLTRRQFREDRAEGYVDTVFDLSPGEVRVMPTDEGALIVRLEGIRPADTESETVQAEMETVADRTSQSISQDIYQVVVDELQSDVPVRVNDSAIQSVLTQFQ
ncbi:peptidylprolyl isomerase [Wenxinia saemankumensis]|uniref:Parvulin-like PPIase n=1 Tax=Wenxinia saemankumensis TaxID=1447782 RepID=A0A1M6D628_9RHOB|nr:peptidylprolyl isomerase [Wenxinia saemankumensis]SHI68488.1 peptidyl-prolyl cis-trans isomerase D [Wenxinia saemankumensis]